MTETNLESVRVRFPPSPTGLLQLGNVRSMLFNYLFAKKHKGIIVYRPEDTDRERSKPEFEEAAKEAFHWLGMDYDEFYRQSERADIHKKYLEQLIADDKAFVAEANQDGSGNVVRFRNRGKVITFQDEVRGEVSFDTTELGDFVIARSLDNPLYHLAVVVDDFEMGITHIIRGEDHISNTPRHILLQEAIGAPTPVYAHIPLVLAQDRSKLSKRNGSISVRELEAAGYIPDAVINYLALLGWNPGTDQEIFTREELIEQFSLEKIQKGGAIFDATKLRWVNKQHLDKLSEEDFLSQLITFYEADSEHTKTLTKEDLQKLVAPIRDRLEIFSDIFEMEQSGEFDFINDISIEDPSVLIFPKAREDADAKETTTAHLGKAKELLSSLSNPNADEVKDALWEYASEVGRGHVLWPLRYALSGREKSVDPFTIVSVIGIEASCKRIDDAIKLLS